MTARDAFSHHSRGPGKQIAISPQVALRKNVVCNVQILGHSSSSPTRKTPITMRLVRYTYPSFRTPAFGSRSPWFGLESEIDRLFETALADFGGTTANRFPVDLYEDEDNTYVRAELPGVNRDDINVEMTDGYLTIAASRKSAGENGQGEESFSFSRAVSIADEVDSGKVNASYENGVLTVTLPKREEAKPKKISVAVK
jgi:HSP20 family protein